MISDKPVVQDLVQLLEEHGVKHAVISPGSRNAPLSISLIHRHNIATYSLVDERAAGYFALGMAQQLKSPVALCCTSGSAGINYGPAVAEAHYQGIPLVVITADRPEEWVNQGDGQTVMQDQMFGPYCRSSVTIHEDVSDPDKRWFAQRKINEALTACTQLGGGPVHLNLPLKEHLYGVVPAPSSTPRKIHVHRSAACLSEKQERTLGEKLTPFSKVLILTGMLSPDKKLAKLAELLTKNGQAVVLGESTSNLAGGEVLTTTDRIIMSFDADDLEAFRPDLLITLGSNIISKKIKHTLRAHPPQEHWHFDEAGVISDTYQCLSEVITLSPTHSLEFLSKHLKAGSPYAELWQARRHEILPLHERFTQDLEWCDFLVFREVLDKIPSNSDVQMGNSSAVRYIQLFESRADLRYFSNRGTSGIDGCVSTAAGASLASGHPTTLIVGDLSFVYDHNGLWHQHLSDQLKIIVVNNGGGNIFKIIDGPSESGVLEEAFEHPHDLDLEHLSKVHKLPHRAVSDLPALQEGLDWLYQQKSCAVLEVRTLGAKNAEKIRQYFGFLRSELSGRNPAT